MKRLICIFLVIFIGLAMVSYAEPIPEDVLKCIAYLTTPIIDNTNGIKVFNKPIGTGFIIGYSYPWDNNYKYMFLVTAKHVLFHDNGARIDKILLRMNDKVTNKIEDYEIISNNMWYFHPDKAVDLAIQPLIPIRANFLVFPSNEFVTENMIGKHKIGLGDDVFYAGMLPYYSGIDRIIPIARFGRIALVTEEKTADGNYYYFIDAGNMPGHSGAPVFLWATPSRSSSQLVAGGRIFGLYGIVSGLIEWGKPLKFILPKSTAVPPVPIDYRPGGVTAIVPVRYLNELLNDKNVISNIKKMNINRFKLSGT